MVLSSREVTAITAVQTEVTTSAATATTASQRPVIDLLVAMIAVPILILCALQLEKHTQSQWAEGSHTRWLVFALGIAMLLISLLICGYVTHRMGVCLWAGPIEETGNSAIDTGGSGNLSHINSQNDILRIIDTLPPSYESVVKFDVPPPPYHCVIVAMEECKEEQLKISDKEIEPMEVVSVHI